MALRDTLKAHFLTNGRKPFDKEIPRFQDLIEGEGVEKGSIKNAIQFIAGATGKSELTVWNWMRQIENGVGHGPDQLDPPIAMALMWMSNQVLVDSDNVLVDDLVAEYIMERLVEYHESKRPKSKRRSSRGKRRNKSGRKGK